MEDIPDASDEVSMDSDMSLELSSSDSDMSLEVSMDLDMSLSENLTCLHNVPKYPHHMYPFIMYGCLLNCVCVMGLVGNVISIMILTRPALRSSINCCFVGLAIFDSILLVSSILLYGIGAIADYTGMLQWYNLYVLAWVVMVFYPISVVAHMGSVYLTVLVTLERYVAVCHPFRARSLCTYGRARIYVIIVAAISLVYNLPRFAEVTYEFCDVKGVKFTTFLPSDLRQNEQYKHIYITWLYMIVMFLVPFLALLIFNIFIFKLVHMANKERQHLSTKQQNELGLAMMLMVVVLFFLCCNSLSFVLSVMEIWGMYISHLVIISNFLVSVNSSVNFLIYCVFGQKFRIMFLNIFCFGAFKSQEISEDSYLNMTQSIRLSSIRNSHSSMIRKNSAQTETRLIVCQSIKEESEDENTDLRKDIISS